ncbi:sugar phosphate isomerase/epimerase family protein [Dyadobacter diqingensis]|uniref:sugar phosphate isomerase/epimerase family protein n=1 Tax=Dyadobacter diqingensis TaxID=2938121 RepID=UPI0020C331C0|nr:sugar phosphate isomerase/epimerase family protein [Dyadobacter diqingensis]
MTLSTRRSFFKSSLGLFALALPEWSLPAQALECIVRPPKLSFSTLGSPAWSLATILKTAVENGYQGVELRGLQNEMDLTKCPEFSSAERAAQTRKLFADQGVQIINLGSSAQLHHADIAKRRQNIAEAQRFIDLAQQLGCPYVRVFPDQLPADQPREHTIRLISEGLLELGDYAKKRSVTVLLESHGELTRSDLLIQIMTAAEHSNVGLIWDVFNMWIDSHENVVDVYRKLKKYIRHTHIKDGINENGKHRYTLIGQGQAPLHEAIKALVDGGYQGFYSFEWEKRWHPELEEPEVAMAHYPTAIKAYF